MAIVMARKMNIEPEGSLELSLGMKMNINAKGIHIRAKVTHPAARMNRGRLLITIKLLIELYKKYRYLKPTIRTMPYDNFLLKM
jgi:hypothetical protein